MARSSCHHEAVQGRPRWLIRQEQRARREVLGMAFRVQAHQHASEGHLLRRVQEEKGHHRPADCGPKGTGLCLGTGRRRSWRELPRCQGRMEGGSSRQARRCPGPSGPPANPDRGGPAESLWEGVGPQLPAEPREVQGWPHSSLRQQALWPPVQGGHRPREEVPTTSTGATGGSARASAEVVPNWRAPRRGAAPGPSGRCAFARGRSTSALPRTSGRR